MSNGDKKPLEPNQGGHTDTSPSILYQNDDTSVVLLAIPRSLEESQVLLGQIPARRIYSDPPPAEPFPTPEPKDDGAARGAGAAHSWPQQSPATQVADLMTAAAVQDALQQLADRYSGPFHLPRLAAPETLVPAVSPSYPVIPLDANYLHGSIRDLRHTLLDTAPKFKLIVLDPPWPNRSARRRTDKYATAASLPEIRALLTSIPVSAHLAPDGLVAVWITNKASIPELLTSPAGVFASWGLELATEWTWVKITSSGEPLYDIDSLWRKPWEKLLIAKPRGARSPSALRPRVVIAAPDIHSRKPNLRGLFQDVLGQSYVGLEVFARNLTAGWWSWGDEVLRFQEATRWAAGIENQSIQK
ncbi:Uncharacterized protein C22G7.07c [Tolypocladium ophioglossoides CBS 100239]|uniref:Uncharacterized protein C22G7.07c n=1 Tax=Tolypocladium ophioglossoides (strain CBS 100239) TaxID=1163406 RepID=A0A0L0N433_TOLOC|nr:Uncharacterized protein C22G7.07c [Tolypocladium ophioglossoides CBS 100239]